MKEMCSRGIRGRPTLPRSDRRRQNSLNPRRCQAMTVFPRRGHGGSDYDQGTLPPGPEPPEKDPKGPVPDSEPRMLLISLVDRELLPQGGVLQGKCRPGQ